MSIVLFPPEYRIAKAAIVNETTTDMKHSEGTLRKGVLLEFSKESGKYVLAVIQRPEGKKNWVAADQASLKLPYSVM